MENGNAGHFAASFAACAVVVAGAILPLCAAEVTEAVAKEAVVKEFRI